MNRFKFFVGKENYGIIEDAPMPFLDITEEDFEFNDNDPSWMWAQEMGIENLDEREIVSVERNGIREFLSMFPRYYIVPMVSITNGVVTHNSENPSEGWGFDISNDSLVFTYVRV